MPQPSEIHAEDLRHSLHKMQPGQRVDYLKKGSVMLFPFLMQCLFKSGTYSEFWCAGGREITCLLASIFLKYL